MRYFLLIAALLCTQAWAAPDKVQAVYDVYMNGLRVGQIDESYIRRGDQYTLTSVTTPLGLMAAFRPGTIHITSQGGIDAHGLRPQSFEDRREGHPEKDSSARFDWDQHLLTLTHQSQQAQLPLAEGTQDRLSAMYQFMFVTFGNIDAIDFAMTNGSKLDDYRYAIGPLQKLSTPAGNFDVRYLDSQGKPGENRTEIWLETRYNLPCKMIITDAGGERLSQVLSSFKINP